MRTKTAEQAEKILNVAVRLFATHRFHEARMEDISAAAGVGKGTLYRYFKDKDELYLALLERASDQMEERLNAAVEQGTTPRDKLEAITATVISYFDEQPYVFDIIQHAEALHTPDRPFPWKARAVSIEVTYEVILEGQRAGLFCVPDPMLAVLLLLGSLRAVIRFGEQPRPADLPRRIVDIFLRGIAVSEPCTVSQAINSHGTKASIN